MNPKYAVGLTLNQPIDIGQLTNQFRGDIYSLGLCVPEKTEVLSRFLFAETINGHEIRFTSDDFVYFFSGTLGTQDFLQGVKSAIELAKKLERGQLSFNPNILRLGLGKFDGDDAFEKEFGHIAGNLQKRLYGGGNVGYFRSSNDFGLYLGTQEEIDKRRGGALEVKKLEFEGITKLANSLVRGRARTLAG